MDFCMPHDTKEQENPIGDRHLREEPQKEKHHAVNECEYI